MTATAQTTKNTFARTENQAASLQKMGGFAGLLAAFTFVFGFALFATTFEPLTTGDLDAVATVEFLRDNQTIFYVWNLVIYVLFGVAQAVLTLALAARLKAISPGIAQVTMALGLIWSGLVIASGMVANVGAAAVIDLYANDPTQAGTVWMAIDSVGKGMGGGNEIVGGLWLLLGSWVALRGALPKSLSLAGILVGAAGIVTLVPMLADVGAIFGLGMIAWYIWAGIVLLRSTN
ncbi:MAG: hypothetical protein CL610_06625 [Anaerolineaceae bacterium]|nr:hypothetical protein [Anaerolineaceae bacterium]